MKRVGLCLLWWAFLFLFWLLLVDTFALPEVLAGAGVAAIGATAAEVVRSARLAPLLPWGLAPRHPGRLAWAVVEDSGKLAVALIQQLVEPQEDRGAFRGIPFDPGGDDPGSAARRAMYTAAISLTPNTYVIGIDHEEGNMLVHELVAGPRQTTAERVLGKL